MNFIYISLNIVPQVKNNAKNQEFCLLMNGSIAFALLRFILGRMLLRWPRMIKSLIVKAEKKRCSFKNSAFVEVHPKLNFSSRGLFLGIRVR